MVQPEWKYQPTWQSGPRVGLMYRWPFIWSNLCSQKAVVEEVRMCVGGERGRLHGRGSCSSWPPWHSRATKGMPVAQYECGEIYQLPFLPLCSWFLGDVPECSGLREKANPWGKTEGQFMTDLNNSCLSMAPRGKHPSHLALCMERTLKF